MSHVPCEKCGSRDNRYLYPDGHSFCFGCRDYIPAIWRGPKNQVPSQKCSDPSIFPRKWAPLPENNPLSVWLEGFSLTEKEKQLFLYDSLSDRLVYQVFDLSGKMLFSTARSQVVKPKNIHNGKKPYHIVGKESNTVIIVEDIISAIKCGRRCSALSLFGATITKEMVTGLVEDFSRIIIWLDRDKFQSSLKMQKMLQNYHPKVLVISTDLDPKDLPQADINALIDEKERR